MKNPPVNRIRLLRHLRDLTQEELADKLGISRQSLYALEKGKCLPSLYIADQIAKFFDASIEELFNFKANKETKMRRGWLPFEDFLDWDWDENARGPWGTQGRSNFGPKVNLYQTEDEVVVEAEVPGVEEKDLNIEVTNDMITIIGQKKEERKTEKENYFRRELSYGRFKRQVVLPVEVESDKAKAATRSGLLMIRIPKKPTKKGKVIKIEPEE